MAMVSFQDTWNTDEKAAYRAGAPTHRIGSNRVERNLTRGGTALSLGLHARLEPFARL